ncbi:MAG TPA: hypothetical protein V6D30_08020 [Leptolyngbyaceae cyanobacterium]
MNITLRNEAIAFHKVSTKQLRSHSTPRSTANRRLAQLLRLSSASSTDPKTIKTGCTTHQQSLLMSESLTQMMKILRAMLERLVDTLGYAA